MSLERLIYNIKDAFSKKTYAESQKKKYENMLEKLNETNIRAELNMVEEQLISDYDKLELNSDCAQGKIKNIFVEKEQINRARAKMIIKNCSDALDDITYARATIESKYDYWCQEVIREDNEMKVYQEEYYASLAKGE